MLPSVKGGMMSPDKKPLFSMDRPSFSARSMKQKLLQREKKGIMMEKKRGEVPEVADERPTCELHSKECAEDEEEDHSLEEGGMSMVGVERNVLKNGGVTKTLVKQVTDLSPRTALHGDEVTVHYTGTLLDGTVFDSSCGKEPFTFNLGCGQVIKGWDKGVKTMRKGEQAIFTLKPEYAYGKDGQPPEIPPDATLKFDIEVLSICSVKDVCRDGGVMKKTIQEGMSWETPKDTDEVTVKYMVKLADGTVVSKTTDEGAQYYIEDGLFCPGISHAVKSMKKGEVAVVTVQPQYGFGQEGREATDAERAVPPNATLTIDLEVMSWNVVEGVSDDNLVVKKILRLGESYEKPNDGSTVTVKYIGTLSDGTIFEKKGYDSKKAYEVCIDEDQVVPGLDEALTSMKKHEKSIVSIPQQYGFGEEEKLCDLARVPGNSTLTYEVEMVDFVKVKDHWNWNASQKIAGAAKKKDQGNNFFKDGKVFHASRKYEKGAKYVEFDTHFGEDAEKKEAKGLKISLNLNDAACKLKMNMFPEVVKLTTKVLEVDETNVKALFRRAQAYSAMMELNLAEQDLKKAIEIDHENRDVTMEQKRVRQKQLAHRKKEAKLYGNMFERIRKMEEKELSNEGLANLAREESDTQENPAQL